MANNTTPTPIHVSLDKLVTLAELGLGVERPLNAEKRKWIKKLVKEAKRYAKENPTAAKNDNKEEL